MEPAVVVLMIAAVVILGLLYLRYKSVELRHKERMTALEKGVAVPVAAEPAASGAPRVYLLRGLLWLFGGIALMVVIFVIASGLRMERRNSTVFDLERRLVAADRLRQHGATEEQIKEAMTQKPSQEQGDPRALAALGFIPVAVGVAYLIFYASEEKRMRMLGPPAHDAGAA